MVTHNFNPRTLEANAERMLLFINVSLVCIVRVSSLPYALLV